ncbi:MAG: tRNA lysidine(34) synthetase TilS [Bdellovibrionota bacterium]|nr:tRNA lysidine(34) synthetase TilS [Bdellovibrionota bacterium]
MEESKLNKYHLRFLNHLRQFVEQYKLFSLDQDLLVAVSGGIDSMVLLHALNGLIKFGYSNSIRAVHINHNTRQGQVHEAKLVEQYCQSLNVEFIGRKVHEKLEQSNFENEARKARYKIFYDIQKSGELILMAHHIDDSFEWTLLQSLRSSSIKGLVGIPLKNNKVIRPFMCVTRNQILKYQKMLDIPFLEDPTNEHLKYERNFLRHEVVNAFKERYPNYLKHYVYRQNEVARRLGLHLIKSSTSSLITIKAPESVLIYSRNWDENFDGLEQALEAQLSKLNPNSRGTNALQFKKVKQALQNNKIGPLSLKSGLKIYLDKNMVLMTKKTAPKLSVVDLGKISFNEFESVIEGYIRQPRYSLSFPFYTIIDHSSIDIRRFDTSFNKEAVQEFKRLNTKYYPALRLLREWSKKRNRFKRMSIKLMLVK